VSGLPISDVPIRDPGTRLTLSNPFFKLFSINRTAVARFSRAKLCCEKIAGYSFPNRAICPLQTCGVADAVKAKKIGIWDEMA